MQAQQRPLPAEKNQAGSGAQKAPEVPLEQKEGSAASAEKASSVRAALPPLRSRASHTPTRGRETVSHVVGMLENRDANVRVAVAARLERIGEYFLKYETLEENDPARINAAASRYQILSGLAKQATGETDQRVVSALQTAARKITTKDEIRSFRKSRPELAEKLFGSGQN